MKYLSTALALMMILFLSSCNENDESMFGSDDRNTESILNGGQGNIVGKITSYLNTLNMDKDTKKTVMQLRNDFVDCYNSSDDECECILNFYIAIKEANINADSQSELMAWIKEQYPDCIPEDKISPCEIIEAVANAYPNNWEFKYILMNDYNKYVSGSEPCDCENLVYFLNRASMIFQINLSMFGSGKHSSGPTTYYPLSKEDLLEMLSKTDCYEYAMSNSNQFKNLLDGVKNPYYVGVGAESADVEGEEDVEE